MDSRFRMVHKVLVKVMQRLIRGDMGLDVQFAMPPQFELKSDLKDLPPEVVEQFESASELRNWGWENILEGRAERFPPAHLLRRKGI